MPQLFIGAAVSFIAGEAMRVLDGDPDGRGISSGGESVASLRARERANRDGAPRDPLGADSEPGGACIGVAGFRRVGGRIVWKGKSTVDNKTYLLIALCSLPVDAISTIYVNDIPVSRSGEDVTTAPWTSNSLKIKLYDGTQTTVDAEMKTAFPGWSVQYVGNQTAYVRVIMDPSQAGDPFDGSTPDFTFAVRGMKFYDPRDAAQSATNSATWTYTNNVALVAAGYLISELGQRVDPATVDWDSVISAANTCDETVDTLDGEESRYACALTWLTSERHEAVLSRIEAAMAGKVYFVGGKWRVHAGAFDDSAAETITPATYAGEGISWSEVRPLDGVANGVRGTFSSPANAFEPRDFPAYQDAAALALDGYEFWIDLDLSAVASASQAQRVARIAYKKRRIGFPASLQTMFNHFDVVANDIVKVTDDLAGFTAKPFRVNRERFNGSDYSLSFDLEHEAADFYDWNTATDEKPYTPEPPLLGGDVSSGTGYVATRDTAAVPKVGGAVIDSNGTGGTVVPNIKVWCEAGLKARCYYAFAGGTFINQDVNAGGTSNFAQTLPSGSGVTTLSLVVQPVRASDGVTGAGQNLYDKNVSRDQHKTNIDGDVEATGEWYALPATAPPSVTASDATTITINCPQILSTTRAANLQLLVNTTNDPSTATVLMTAANGSGGANHVFTKLAAGQLRYFWARGRTSGGVNGPASPALTVEFT